MKRTPKGHLLCPKKWPFVTCWLSGVCDVVANPATVAFFCRLQGMMLGFFCYCDTNCSFLLKKFLYLIKICIFAMCILKNMKRNEEMPVVFDFAVCCGTRVGSTFR